MVYRNFAELENRVKSLGHKTIVVAASHDLHTLEALCDASKTLDIGCLLVGDKAKTLEICKKIGFDVNEELIYHTENDEESAKVAVELVRVGKADVLMKGILQTATLLKAVLNKEWGIRGGGVMSHLAVLESPAYHKLMFITDGGMTPYPDLNQKRQIIENTVGFMLKIGYDEPKVAALAAVESVSDKMPETLDAKELETACANGEIKNCIVHGPLSIDLAISRESAEIKGVINAVTGDADVLLMPNIATGNIMSKSLLYLGNAKMAGCVLGATAPIVLVSRGASAEEKRLSIMFCLAGE